MTTTTTMTPLTPITTCRFKHGELRHGAYQKNLPNQKGTAVTVAAVTELTPTFDMLKYYVIGIAVRTTNEGEQAAQDILKFTARRRSNKLMPKSIYL